MKHKSTDKSPPVENGVSKPVVCWTRLGVPICCEYQESDGVYMSTQDGAIVDCVEWQEIE